MNKEKEIKEQKEKEKKREKKRKGKGKRKKKKEKANKGRKEDTGETGRTTAADGTQGSRPAARTWSGSHSAVRSPPLRGAPRVPRPRPKSDSRRSLLPSGRPEPSLPFRGAAAVTSIDDDRSASGGGSASRSGRCDARDVRHGHLRPCGERLLSGPPPPPPRAAGGPLRWSRLGSGAVGDEGRKEGRENRKEKIKEKEREVRKMEQKK